MSDWPHRIRAALVSGSCAGVGSALGLAVAARREGKWAVQPLNATSHWRNGDAAAEVVGVDWTHTGVGWLTNHAASVFWAACFEAWLAWRAKPLAPAAMLREAAVISAVAAAVDYGLTPKRFTPGWELVLSKKGMAVAYAGLALGLAAGSLIEQRRRSF